VSALNSLLPASWRGVVFGVEAYTNELGRRIALHEYPYKDSVWAEDLGSGRKQFQFRGFLNGPLAAVQHAAFLLAVDKPGLGTLTHPTLGIFQGVITTFTSHYSAEAGGVYELDITFTQSVEPAFPGASADWLSQINLGSLNVFSAAGTWFGTALSAIGIASAAISVLPSVIAGWIALPQQMIGDALAIANSVTGLGASFGPYAVGSGAPAAAGATPASLQAAAGVARAAAVAATRAAVVAAATGVAPTVVAAVQAVPAAVRAAINEPTDQIRTLLTIASYSPATQAATDPVGLARAKVQQAAVGLCLYATLAELARAAAAYNFTSYDQAAAVSSQVAAALSAGILLAGDAGADQVCQALRVLRAAVVQYLADIGAVLAPLRTVTFRAPLPALAIAQRLYQDGTRSDELIRNARPWHPAFMPATMTVPAT
jgi:prophage DNA circulation protein